MTFVPHQPDEPRPKRRRRRLRTIQLLPSLFTLGNLLCGFAAVYFALRATYDFASAIEPSSRQTLDSELWERLLPSFISVGAGLVLLGMILDLFDGLIARIVKRTTDFGGQLDSLADVVTSGMAPMVLMLAYMMDQLKTLDIHLSPISNHFFGRFAWVCAAVYVACAAVRLARFNVEHSRADYDHRMFRGLPSPGAAGMMVALLIWFEQVTGMGLDIPVPVVLGVMPAAALAVGLLMVSRVPYRKLTVYLRGRRPFRQLVIMIFLFAIFWVFKSLALVVLALAYVLSGPLTMLFHTMRRRRRAAAAEGGEAAAPANERQSG